MNKNILYGLMSSAAFFAAVLPSFSQNLDPTVVVSRNYEGKLMEVHKPSLGMSVPDSVTRFDLDFDYSVFDSPYKGAYEFSPYVLTMRPAPRSPQSKKFYLRAGAGYPLHPVFDMIWSPSFGKGFRMDVYAMHGSFVGQYRAFRPSAYSASRTVVVDRWKSEDGTTSFWKGYDLNTRAGVDGSYDWEKGTFDFDVAYRGLASDDWMRKRAYNALDFKAGVASAPAREPHFLYDVSVAYLFADDRADFAAGAARQFLNEHVFGADVSLGQDFKGGHKLLFDVAFNMSAYSGALNVASGEFSIAPHYVFEKGRWNLDLGVLLAKTVRSNAPDSLFATRGQLVYPDVSVRFSAIPDAMSVYVKACGGNRMNTYASLTEKNRHVDMAFGRGSQLLDYTVERVRAELGLEGRIGGKFSYDLSAGYSNCKNAAFDAVVLSEDAGNGTLSYLPGIAYAPYSKLFARADFCLKTESVRADGVLAYNYVVSGFGDAAGLFAPPAFSGDVAFEYNWNRRIFAGVDCAFALARAGSLVYDAGRADAVIPGYADLGLSFEVAVSRSFSLWLRGGNLLNMTVQRNPLYAERGISFTAGICFNL